MKQIYSLLDHTADIGIKVRGKTYPELFVNAASGMFEVMGYFAKEIKRGSQRELTISLKANNMDELLHDWLSELLSLSDARGLIFNKFEIKKIDERAMTAAVSGAARNQFTFERDIKAVTYHNLKIQQRGGQYYVEIIFDV